MMAKKDVRETARQETRGQDIADRLPYVAGSLCPVCRQVIEAQVYEEDGKVWMKKACADHGAFRDLLSSDADFFLHLRRAHCESPVPVAGARDAEGADCPMACGLCERHLSSPVLVNIDLTSRCNLNCPICFADSNAAGRTSDLTMDELDRILEKVVSPGRRPSCLQLAGGEPTVHKDFIDAVRRTKCAGVPYVQVASNGLRFAQDFEFCQAASEAGLNQVYLQFDGVTDEVYLKTRKRPLLETKLKAIENIAKANMWSVLVPTLVKGVNDHQVGDIARFAVRNVDAISGISWQPVAITGRIDEFQRIAMRYTTADLAGDLEQQWGFPEMHRDWYPFSVVQPLIHLVEAVTRQPLPHYSCHPNCGCATYLVVDKQSHTAVPLPQFLDVEMMKDLDRIAARIERHPLTARPSVLQAMRSVRKHFHTERAPKGWGFEEFRAFVKMTVEISDEQADKASYAAQRRKKRFATLVMAAMHFQDAYNFELPRVQRCVIVYAAPDGRFYPFCTWNSGPCHRHRAEEDFGGFRSGAVPWRRGGRVSMKH
jgi:uncharacterized radical SAM superfamily Fe-S cluster-containing enzyme